MLLILAVPGITFDGRHMSNGVLHTISANLNLSRGISLSTKEGSANAF